MSGHVVKTTAGRLPGTWRSVCSCGWESNLYGSTGARSRALWAREGHLLDAEGLR